jgi:hypothetical protein
VCGYVFALSKRRFSQTLPTTLAPIKAANSKNVPMPGLRIALAN